MTTIEGNGRAVIFGDEQIIGLLSDLKHRLFPRPFERIGVSEIAPPDEALARPLLGVEVGVAGGLHAESLLARFSNLHLYLVDPYSIDADDDQAQWYWAQENRYDYLPTKTLLELRDACKQRLANYSERTTFVYEASKAASESSLIPGELDFVYLDANHSYRAVWEDISLWWPKLRPGGLIGGHDFYNGWHSANDGLIRAVVEFTHQNALNLKVEYPDWWVYRPL